MILVDSNVPMYLTGAPHPHKTDTERALQRIATSRERLVTDAEVLQEILHRYRSLGRRNAVQPTFDTLLGIVDEVLPVGLADVERARDILLSRWRLSARDAVHVAIMQRHGIRRILTFDTTFDQVPGIERLP